MAPYGWTFFRAGGLDQVRIDKGADIEHLDELDQKLWVALACPVRGLELDERTLSVIDQDKDGRVRAPELLQAVKFCRKSLMDLEGLFKGTDSLPLASLRLDTELGRTIGACARAILTARGQALATHISLEEIREAAEILAKSAFNGDGIIDAGSCPEDPWLQGVLVDIMATQAPELDRRGEPGVSLGAIELFFQQLGAVDSWAGRASGENLPLSDRTEAAWQAMKAVGPKIDDFFARCRVAAFDPRAQTATQHAEAEYAPLLCRDLSAAVTELAAFPIAIPEAGMPLTFGESINPAWHDAMERFREHTVIPLIGEQLSILEDDWALIQERLAPYGAWIADRPETPVASLPLHRVRELLDSEAPAHLRALVERDKAYETDFQNISQLEKLLLLHRDLVRLLNNFIAFSDLYEPDRLAAFQAGTLFIDGRSCELCLRVEDSGKHATMAAMAACYLAYCDCTRPGEKMSIVAVLSGGDRDYIMVGRNGIFYDRQGQDWDATIVKVVENPIGLREAFYSPYKKFVRMVEQQISRRATEAETATTTKLGTVASATASADKAVKSPAPSFDLSSIALIGVAVSGLTAVLGGLLQAFFGLGIWMPLGILGIIMAISGPSMLIAALKLRQRNLGPVLDANGWAINGRVKVNIPFGGSLTKLQTFPVGSRRSFLDPYQQHKSPWIAVLYGSIALILLCGLGALSYHQGWMSKGMESKLCFLGVPTYLEFNKDTAQKAVEDARVVLTSAIEQHEAARKASEVIENALRTEALVVLDKANQEVALARAALEVATNEASVARYRALRFRTRPAYDLLTKAEEKREVASFAVEDSLSQKAVIEARVEKLDSPKLQRARERLERAEAKLQRAETRLDKVEQRLEIATELLEDAINAKEARQEAAEVKKP